METLPHMAELIIQMAIWPQVENLLISTDYDNEVERLLAEITKLLNIGM